MFKVELYDATLREGVRGLRYGLPVESEVLTFVTSTETHDYEDPVPPTFEDSIDPIFQSSCAFSECHGSVAPAAGLDLSTSAAIATTAVGSRGRGWPGWIRIEPGSSSWSYLVYKVLGEETVRGGSMPPGALLSDEEIDLLVEWIDGGAKVDLLSNDP